MKDKKQIEVFKQKLNSSYGKLAERVERQTGHYELLTKTDESEMSKKFVYIDTDSIHVFE